MPRLTHAPRTPARVAAVLLLAAVASSTFAGDRQEITSRPSTDLESAVQLVIDGRFAQAEVAARAQLACAEARCGRDSIEAADACQILTQALRRGDKTGDPETLALAERAVSIHSSRLGECDARTAASLYHLGVLYLTRGDSKRARPPLERALAIREGLFAEGHRDVAWSLIMAAEIEMEERGDDSLIDSIFDRAASIQARLLPRDHPDVAFRLARESKHAYTRCDFATARALDEQALAIYRRTVRHGHPFVGMVLHNLGLCLENTGDFTAARAAYEESLDVRIENEGALHPNVASSQSRIAGLAYTMGDREAASAGYEQALAIQERTYGLDSPALVHTLRLLADVQVDAGAPTEARHTFERALAIAERQPHGDDAEIAHVHEQLGDIAEREGRPSDAAREHDAALAIAKHAPPQDVLQFTDVLFADADRALESADAPGRAGARNEIERLVHYHERVLAPDDLRLAQPLFELAHARALCGDARAAFALALRSEAIAREHFLTTAVAWEERALLHYGAVQAGALLCAAKIAALPGNGDLARDLWDAIVRSRALTLDEMAARRAVAGRDADPRTRELAQRLAAARERFSNLAVRGQSGADPEVFEQQLRKAREERDACDRRLAEASASWRERLEKRSTGLADVARDLPRGAALVGYTRLEGHKLAGREREQRYFAFVIARADAEPRMFDLGDSREIESSVANLLVFARSSVNEKDYRRLGEELRARIWDPLASSLSNAQRVFVVGDGALHLVSLAALPDKDGYLVESGPLVQGLCAERDLLHAGEGMPIGRGLLAIGGPDFDASPETPSPSLLAMAGQAESETSTARGITRWLDRALAELSFSALPAAAREVEDIAQAWREKMPDDGLADRARVLSGGAATEAAFKSLAHEPALIHVATHGFFLDASGTTGTGRGVGLTVRPNASARTLELPLAWSEMSLLRSGLVFAGANRRAERRDASDDGILTAEEIAGLDMSQTGLVVISACDSGLGEILNGEGVFGLSRAFKMAGARRLVLSLWPVDDQAGRRWMQAFYRAEPERDHARAVRAASLAMLAARRAAGESTHPFYWGGFVALGRSD